ncbi:MAG: hypothetical protein HY299_23045 [Verrucomicrobia bacterium]|nr:hypothetical protein [Verrucomicrobiota bacterium]
MTPEPRSPEGSSHPAAAETGAKAGRRATRVVRTFGERCELVLTSLPALSSVGAASVGLILWVLVAELPRTLEKRLVSARSSLEETQKAADEAAQHEAIDQAVLNNQVALARRFLIQDKDQLVSLASVIEKMAKASGLQAEVSNLAASERAPIVPQVTIHSSLVRIQPLVQKGRTNATPMYSRLLPFLAKLDELTNKVEISAISVAADRNGAASAQLELQFWVRKGDEKHSGK